MASVSPPFEVEEQADEEFFDQLVDDEDNSNLGNKELNEAKSLTNSSITPIVAAEVDSRSTDSFSIDGKRDHDEKLDTGARNSLAFVDVVDAAVMESKLDNETSENNVQKGTGVKEVDWSAFSYDSQIRSGGGFGSCSDFFNELDDSFNQAGVSSENVGGASEVSAGNLSSVNYGQHQEGQTYGLGTEGAMDGQDQSIQYWENLYPGWKYDAITGQWRQLEGYNEAASTQQSHDTVRQGSQGNWEYPAHMLFDPQYPGWYYDSVAQEWRTLESYTAAMRQSEVADHSHNSQNGHVSTVESSDGRNQSAHDNFQQAGNYWSQDLMRKDRGMGSSGSTGDYNQQIFNMSQPEPVPKVEAVNVTENKVLQNPYGSNYRAYNYSGDQQNQQMRYKSSVTSTSSEQASQSFDNTNGVGGVQRFSPDEKFYQHHNQHKSEPSQQFSPAYIDNQNTLTFPQRQNQNGSQFFKASDEGRSSAGRPPHALVKFGFGGKLIVMRHGGYSLTSSPYETQESDGDAISIINLIELVMDNSDDSCIGLGVRDYFYTLCQQSFPGPLVGMSVANRELNKWIDDKIANCGSPDMDYRKGERLRLLFSLLKVACQYKGKLRSPFGTDHALKESDSPESAVADLFASAKRNVSEYGALSRCLQNFPSEGKIQATALKVQNLLVSGRIKDALRSAQEGQLWGPALVLASQLGDQFYGDTVKRMALHQFVDGSPLRTLCLLISGQPADVFCSSNTASSLPGVGKISQQPVQNGALAMLQDWEENLAIITANRTNNDELVIIHLGDCLWKEKAEVIGAHICYLVAEANFESYSDSARMCLIGADHWRSPRTYASPDAIQRTELYEYAKALGNSQFLLLPFQPYKLIYALMLAEVGKLSESLKYCQAILKCSKIGRAPEVDTLKHLVSSLEERIRIHQHGGYTASLAPAKLVGKLLNLFDSTAQRVIGGLPPPVPSTSHSKAQHKHERQKVGPRVPNGQSTMSRPSLAPSASMEPLSEWTGSRTPRHNRSISEPDIGKSPRKCDSSKEADMHEKATGLRYSRFGRFGSQLFQKTVGRVLRSHTDRQAKLGEKNKFYYDENLKRWVEEGAELPSEEAALLPPPTTAALQNKFPTENLRDGLQAENFQGNSGPESISPTSSDSSSGIPPIPHSLNHFTTRGRMGIRARYVDTFHKGGGIPASLLQSPVISPKPGIGPNPKFFVSSPVSSANETIQMNFSPTSFPEDPLLISPPSLKSSTGTIQRIPSMDNIMRRMEFTANSNNNSPLPPHSRRTVSWSGSFSEVNPSNIFRIKTLGEALGTPPLAFSPNEISPHQFSMAGSDIGDYLQEVELK